MKFWKFLKKRDYDLMFLSFEENDSLFLTIIEQIMKIDDKIRPWPYFLEEPLEGDDKGYDTIEMILNLIWEKHRRELEEEYLKNIKTQYQDVTRS